MHREKSALLGLIGVIGIWITAGAALPFVNYLSEFTPTQLMVFRGFITALLAGLLLKGKVFQADRLTYLMAVVLPLATLGLYQGIRAWGAGPTIIIITATPIVNFAVAYLFSERVPRAAFVGLLLLLGGVALAQWNGHFSWAGFTWSVFGTFMNGILYELFAESKSSTLVRIFWTCAGMGLLGLGWSLSSSANWTSATRVDLLLSVLAFALVGGLLYWLANLLAFDNLPTPTASVLAQGETPAVIVGAYLLLGEKLNWLQWLGVIIALMGACYLANWIAKQNAPDKNEY